MSTPHTSQAEENEEPIVKTERRHQEHSHKTFGGAYSRRLILLCLEDYIENRGYAPTVREIALLCGLSKTTVQYHLHQLAAAGFVRLVVGVHRSLALTPRGEAAIS